MSQQIDERVVSLKFNNKQFEAKIDATLKQVEQLNKGLKFEGASRGISEVAESTKDLDMSRFEKSLDAVTAKIGVFQMTMYTCISRLTNAIIDFGKRTIDAFAIHPVTTGFQEYELKMGSVQTIMNATGESVGVVNKYLDELNKYSDKTIYSFADMTNNIGKFTNAGVGLEDAVAAIQGISNEAALAGATASQASHAMYNFAQALSSGSVKLLDWRSIETAQMATEGFRQALLDTAVEMGTVAKTSDGMYRAITTNGQGSGMKGTMTALRGFNDSLNYQWLTSEVLIKTLKKYSDETTELGRQATAAATEVKTFSMMVDTLMESAQSGWAETWQLVTGDFEEAKALFTDLTKTFDAILSAMADARNELIGNAMMLENSEGVSGREALWKALTNLLENFIAVCKAVKKAWEDVFAPMTDMRLRDIIESLLKFSEALKQDDERLEKIRSTFKGIFSIIKLVVILVRYSYRVVKSVILNIGDLLGKVLFISLGLLLSWIEDIQNSTTGFNGWLNSIGQGVKRFVDYVTTLDGLTVENVLLALKSFAQEVLGAIFNFDNLKQIGEQFVEDFKYVLDRLGIDANFGSGKLKQIFNDFVGFIGTVKDRIISVLLELKERFDNGDISFGQIFAVGLGITLLLIGGSFKSFINMLSEVGEKLGKLLGNIGGAFKSFAKLVKAQAMFAFAKGIFLLVAGLAVLTALDPERVYKSLAVLGILAAGFVAMSIAMSKVDAKGGNLAFAGMLIGMGIAIKTLANALSSLQGLKLEDLTAPLLALVGVSAIMIAIAKVMGSKDEKYFSGALTFISFAVSLKVLANTLNYLTTLDAQGMGQGLNLMLKIATVLAIIGVSMKNVKFGSAVVMIAAVVAIKMLFKELITLGEMDLAGVKKAITVVAEVFGMFGILMVIAAVFSKTITGFSKTTDWTSKTLSKSERDISGMGSLILKISAGFVLIMAGLKMINKFTPEEMEKAKEVAVGVLLAFAVIVATSLLAGKNADKAGSMMMKMSVAMLVLSGVLSILSLFSDPSALDAPVAILQKLMITMGLVVAVVGFASKVEDLSKTINSLTIAMIGLSTLAIILTLVDPNKLMETVKIMSVLMLAFAVVAAASSKVSEANKTITALAIGVVAIGGVLGILSSLGIDAAHMVKVAESIGIVIAAFALATAASSTIKSGDGVIQTFLGLTVVVGLLAGVIALVSGIDASKSIQNAAGIAILLTSLSVSLKIIGESDGFEDIAKVTKSLIGLSVVAGLLGAVLGIMAGMDAEASIPSALAIGVLLAALSASFRLMSGQKALADGVIEQFTIMSGVLAVLGMIMGFLAKSDAEASIGAVTAMSVLLLGLVAAFKILQGTKALGWNLIAQIAVIAGVMTLMGGLIGALESMEKPLKVGIESALSLSVMLVAMSASLVLLSKVGKTGMDGFVGILLLMALIGGISLVMFAIGEMCRENENVEKDLDYAIMVFDKIGNGLGSLIGGIVNGVLQSIDFNILTRFGEDINGFINAFKPAVNSVNEIDQGALDKMGSIAGIILTLTGSSLIDGISRLLGGGNSLAAFGVQLPILARGLRSFGEITSDMAQNENVDNAIGVLSKLAEVGKTIPNQGGILAGIVGDNKIGDFARQFWQVGTGIVAFVNITSNMNYGDHVNKAIDVMKDLASVSKEIPNTGGWLGGLVGDNDMGPFAEQFPIAARGIVSFTWISKLGSYGAHVYQAIGVLSSLAKASYDIPNTGGLLGDLVGNNDLGAFSEQFPVAGEGIKSFCQAVTNIKTEDVPAALDVLSQIVQVSKTMTTYGGWDAFWNGEVDMARFGKELTSIGWSMYLYSTHVDKIKSFDNVVKSIEVLTKLGEMSNNMAKVGDANAFAKFGEALVSFGEGSLSAFVKVFDTADVQSIGKKLTDGIANAIHSERVRFVGEGQWIVGGFISGLHWSIQNGNVIANAGVEMAETFLNAFDNRMDINSPAKEMDWRGQMTVEGFEEGADPSKMEEIGTNLSDTLIGAVNDTLGIFGNSSSVAKEQGEAYGTSFASGAIEKLTEGLSQFEFSQVPTYAEKGKSWLSNVIQNNLGLDTTAKLGDNLYTLVDKAEKYLLGDNNGGLFGKYKLGDILDDVVSETNKSLQGAMDGLGDSLTGTSSKTGNDIAEALRVEFHKHFSSPEYEYLGRQLGETLSIAANGAIVGKSNVSNIYLDEIKKVTSRGIDEWKAWVEVRNKYELISVKDQLAGWELLRQKYAEGTKERMEADQQVHTLQKQLVKDTFDYSKKWIDNEKYYERLSLEEEIAAWERIQARYMEGSEQRIEAEKELYNLRKELRKKDLEDQKKWIQTEKTYNRLPLADELAAYLRIQKTLDEGSEERAEIDEQIYSLRKEIYEAQLKYTADVEAAEKEAADSRADLEQEYADKVLEINQKLADDIASLNEDYANSVDQRKRSLYSAYGLFDAVKDEEYDAQELMDNLKDQVRSFESWQSTLNQLSSRGLDKALIDELTEMGPSAKGQLEALNSMTDAELGQYNLLWSQKSAMAREQAITELDDLRVETSDNIAKLQQESAKELDDYRKTWAESMAKITEDCETRLEELRKEFGEKVGTIKTDTAAKLREMTEVSNKILREAGWTEAGEQMANGLIKGLLNKKNAVALAGSSLALVALNAIKARLKIASPSKATQQAGEFAGEGLVKGLKMYEDRVYKEGKNLGEEIQNGAFEAIRYVNDLVENGMDATLSITPVLDITNVRSSITDLNNALSTSKALTMASDAHMSLDNTRNMNFINPNENVVKAVQELRKDVRMLGEQVESMQIVMDTGAVVGQIAGPIDSELGSRMTRSTRERGKNR